MQNKRKGLPKHHPATSGFWRSLHLLFWCFLRLMAYIVCIGAIGATGTVEMTIGLTDHRSHRTRRSHQRLWSHHSVEAQPFQDLRIQSQKQGWNVFLDPIQAFLGWIQLPCFTAPNDWHVRSITFSHHVTMMIGMYLIAILGPYSRRKLLPNPIGLIDIDLTSSNWNRVSPAADKSSTEFKSAQSSVSSCESEPQTG